MSGTPKIMEPGKIEDIGWFPTGSMPEPLTASSRQNYETYLKRFGSKPPIISWLKVAKPPSFQNQPMPLML